MTLNAKAQTILDLLAKAEAGEVASPEKLGAVKLRDLFKKTRGAFTPETPDVGKVEEFFIQGQGGKIPVRYYRPMGPELDRPLPLLVYYHGGGWVVGDLGTHEVICRMLNNWGQFSVVNVDYRLAPENKFPAAVEDAWTTFKWAVDGAGGRLIDEKNVAVGWK